MYATKYTVQEKAPQCIGMASIKLAHLGMFNVHCISPLLSFINVTGVFQVNHQQERTTYLYNIRFDGTPTVSQCPIPPGSNFTYRFRADQYGSSWYHAHYSAQYTAGLVGPMIIYGPLHYTYDIDIGPVMLIDWYHQDYETIVSDVMKPGPIAINRPHSDSNLIQGKGYYPCANVTDGATCGNAGLAEFQFTSGKQHKLRLINAGGELFTTFSIDNHTMTVVANDFVPVEPYQTKFVTLGVGQRTDIIVKGTGNPGEAYWMRSFNGLCGDPLAPDGRAVIFYENANISQIPTTTGYIIPKNTRCLNDPLSLTTPVFQIPANDPDVTLTVTMTHGLNGSNTTLWFMNDVAYEGDYNSPVLIDAISGTTQFPLERSVYDLGENTTVRLIFYNTFLSGHPMHIHGHDFQVLAEGWGTWNGSIINPSNPQRRDVQQNAGGDATNPNIGSSYTVFQWTQDNPGVWPFHCHIAWHLSAGMNVLLGERLDEVAKMKPPQSVADNCQAWNAFTSNSIVDQVDDGMRKRSKIKRAIKDTASYGRRRTNTVRRKRPAQSLRYFNDEEMLRRMR
jgi:FtsP/CotA-like multicopper oxidase with cupredoxin domain